VARVDLGPDALADLESLSALIERDGGAARADAYLARLHRRIAMLETFPDAGRPLPALGRGIRLLGFERRVAIVYRRSQDHVVVLRVLYAGRQP
jgi:toxin ParE1/3/4